MDSLDYLGREHFVWYGKNHDTEKLATNTFYILVGRITFPNDSRLPDFTKIGPGLAIVGRADTDLGELPDFAKYARSRSGFAVSEAAVCEDLAIGTLSLRKMTDYLAERPIDRPDRMGRKTLEFCDNLLASNGINKAE